MYCRKGPPTPQGRSLLQSAATSLALFVAFFCPALVRAACPEFSAVPSTFPTGYGPTSAAAGDFNADGRPDLALANRYGASISVLMANGAGTFATAVNYATAASPMSIVTADFDRDGKLDLAVGTLGNNSVGFLKGNGNGTFQAPTLWPTPGPVFLAAADLDGDSKLDLAVANSGTNQISFLKSNGSGGFAAAVNFTVNSSPQWIAIDDFNRDGKPDLAVADYVGSDVAILTGDGIGGFGTAVLIPMPGSSRSALSRPAAIVSGDFDRDGKPDLAVANATSYTLAVLRGNGNGSFGTPAMQDLAVEPRYLIRADFNGDGRDDLAIAQWDMDYPVFNDRVSVLMGDGSGNFTSGATIDSPDGTQPASLAAADFNRDGKTDLATANGNNLNDVSILLNSGHCYVNCSTFGTAAGQATSSAPKSTAFGDFNRDGRIDLVAASPASNKVDVFLATAPGTFSTSTSFDAGTGPGSVIAADFNRDGILDLAAGGTSSEYVAVLIGNGSGGFSSPATYYAGTTMTSIIAGDFDRDGKLDLAASGYGSGGVSVLIGNGSGAFASGTLYTAGSLAQSVASGDLDGDGITDLAVAAFDGVWIRRGLGDGQFVSGGGLDAGTSPVSVAAGDFNGDTLQDLAVANSGSDDVSLLLATSPGVFATAVNYAIGSAPTSLVVGDFTRDGYLDVMVSNGSANGLSILRGIGDGTFAAAAAVDAGSAASHIASADIDDDGKPDLAVASAGSSTASILLNACPAPDLTVVKSHSGSFAQGQAARLYSIVVSNITPTATAGVVTVTDTLPAGLTAVDISGSGWTCTLATLTCTRSDALSGNSSYPAITLMVNVDLNAPANVTNVATVSGGSQVNDANDTSSDPAPVTGYQDMSLTKSHTGNFYQGQTGATYTIVVTNVGRASTSGTVTMTDTLPAGLTASAISGTGWTCTLAPLRCTRSSVLTAGASYPQITVTVNVAADAASTVTNTAAVSGGNQLYTGNDVVTDPTSIDVTADLTIEKKHSGSFTQGQTGATYTVTVSNIGSVPTNGAVTVTDALPAGLTAAAIGGSGWSCVLATLSCSRNDAVPAAASFPAITVTVNVNSNAAATVTNTASVSTPIETNTANNSATDPTNVVAAVLIAPTNLIATAVSSSAINVTWDAVTGAVSYQVFRRSDGQPFSLAGSVELPPFADAGRSAGKAYVYRVVAINASASASAPSNSDVATTSFFTDDPIVARSTLVKGIHLTEMRTAVNAVRSAAGLTATSFTGPSPAGLPIRALHITELRASLGEARAALGLTPLSYADPSVNGLAVKAAHIREVRDGVK